MLHPCCGAPASRPATGTFVGLPFSFVSSTRLARGWMHAVCLLAALAIAASPVQAQVYVDADATGAGDGSSWENAYPDLQSALSAAASTDEIWIAAGTYTPTTGTDRTVRFRITGSQDGLAIYGGFDGTESRLADRDLSAGSETILSGDIGTTGDASDNTYHVLVFDGTVDGPITRATILDGVTITAGNADEVFGNDEGGGMRIEAGSPRISNVTFEGNHAFVGGALFLREGDPHIAHARFVDNTAENIGGAVYIPQGSPLISNTTFESNTAVNSGGAIYNTFDHPSIVNATFVDNVAGGSFGAAGEGGAIRNAFGRPRIVNAVFLRNRAANAGGAIYNEGAAEIVHATFTDNRSGDYGGALVSSGFGATVTNAVFSGNSGRRGRDMAVFNSPLTLSHTLVRNGGTGIYLASSGGLQSIDEAGAAVDGFGGTNRTGDPLFMDASNPAGADGVFRTADDGLQVKGGSPVLDAGDTAALPADVTDLDGDGDTTEPLPLDGAGRDRVIDNDGDADTPASVDLGAYEAPVEIQLPVELASFEAAASTGRVTLLWRTLSETNNAGFAVERRIEGTSEAWTALGRVPGAGTTVEPQSYRFDDTALPYAADVLVYRLRQVDVDGTETLTDPLRVTRTVQGGLELRPPSPNPTHGPVTVRFAIPAGTHDARLALYDLLGREVRTLDAPRTGRHERLLSTDGLASGVYFLRLTGSGRAQTQRITVVQ